LNCSLHGNGPIGRPEIDATGAVVACGGFPAGGSAPIDGGGDHGDAPEDVQRTQRDVLEVTDRRGDDKKRPSASGGLRTGHRLILLYYCELAAFLRRRP